MRRTIAMIGLVAVTALGGAWSFTASAAEPEGAERVTLAPDVARATRSYGVGPRADYDFDYGSIGTAQPLRLAFPGGATYDVVVTVSFDYRTSADDRFVVGLLARRSTEFGHRETVRPPTRAIPASTIPTSTSATFLLKGLVGGRDYWFSPTVNVSHREGNRASIVTRRVAMVVDATPTT